MEEASECRVPNILIADDDPALLRFLKTRCAKMGFEVQTATNGLQALLLARRMRPDVVIADLNMPEVDGLTMALKLFGQDSSRLDIVLMSASNFLETPGRCDSLGLFYVPKDLNLWNGIQSALAIVFPNFVSRADEESSASISTVEISLEPRVLLIDDDPRLGTFIKSRLKKLGVDLVLASDGPSALRYAMSEWPAVIISNLFMPNCDAHYLLMRLRAAEATKRVPVIILSEGNIDDSTKTRLNVYGSEYEAPLHYLVKPFDTDTLFNLIQKYCAFRINPSTKEEYLYRPSHLELKFISL